MVVLPTGFELPPLQYTFVLVAATIIVTALLIALDPPIDQRYAVALAPWMAVGGALHAFYQMELYPAAYEPLFGTPAVYFTAYVLTGLVWLLVAAFGLIRSRYQPIPRNLGLIGLGVLTVLFIIGVRESGGDVDIVWSAFAVLVAILNTVFVVAAIAIWRTPVFVRTRWVGPTVIFAHALDGVSTAIGADVIGVHERSPIPKAIMDFAGQLPIADAVGVGWLFLLVKLVVAAAIVISFNRYVDEDPVQSTIVLSGIVAVGLGPALNNLFLFMMMASV